MDNDQLPSFPSFPARSVFPSGNYGSGGIGSGEFGGSWATAVAENSNGGKLFGGGSFSSSPGREQARLASAFAAVGSAPPQAPQPLALAFAPAPFLAPGHSHVSSPEIYRQFSPVFAAAAHAAQAQAPLQLPPLFGGGGGGSLGGSLDTLGSGGGSGPASPGFEEFMKQLATVRSAGSAGAISSGLDRSGALGSGGGGSGGGGGGEAASGGWKLFPSPSLIAPEATALEAAAAVLPPTRRSSRSRVLPNVGGAGALSSSLGDWGATFAARASSAAAAAAAAASEIGLLVPPFPQQQQQQQRQQPAAAATPASSSRRPAPRRQRAILPTGPSPTKKEKKKGTAVAKKKKKRAPPPPRKKRVAVAAGVSGSGKKTSNFRGVSFHSRSGRFESHCWHRSYGRQRFLGAFACEWGAAEAFDLAQLCFLGDEGDKKLNFHAGRYPRELRERLSALSADDLVEALRAQAAATREAKGGDLSEGAGLVGSLGKPAEAEEIERAEAEAEAEAATAAAAAAAAEEEAPPAAAAAPSASPPFDDNGGAPAPAGAIEAA